ncbi:TetR/AcrR family transcriptional regulator [Tessaracoccus sp. SD287]|uniref:TetR/AcrR family transcriptional regulator n=1 Tax=Tessaracoccus sp. SD287 TaxID=2782008 RepID=UPI001A970CCD|nr:TetR/AcrR family transcriptional regulator [Tessaracoccus sp. SD287]MBO1031612.1 TetR/AcrR family transcriptional regulator [Tessaracoccus sp. SD287]
MPKISAATVDEHRASQRTALLRSGEAILAEAGVSGVTPRAVCERVGLGRSSFYDYFPTKDDLLVAIAIDAIERWDAELEQVLSGVESGLPALRALVEATMAMAASGRHAIAGTLREAQLSPQRFEDLMTLHDALLRPVVQVLSGLGVPDPAHWTMLVQGVLGAGVQLVEHGTDHQRVAADVLTLLVTGLPR